MNLDIKEIANLIYLGNWKLKINPLCRDFYIEVVNEKCCNTMLEKLLLKQLNNAYMGNKALFFGWDGNILIQIIKQLYEIDKFNYHNYIEWL